MKKVALLMGNRLSQWHTGVFEALRSAYDIRAFASSSNLFDMRGIKLPVEPIYYEGEAGPWIARKWTHAKYKALHKLGYNMRLADFTSLLKGYDIIHTWELYTEWSFQAALAKERFGNKLLVTVWDTIPFNVEKDRGVKVRKARVLSAADGYVVYSDKSRESLLLEGADPKKVFPASPGVDTARFDVRAQDLSYRERLGLRRDDTVVLFVGRLVWEKGIYDLLYGFRKLAFGPETRALPLKLLIAGDGPEYAGLEKMIERIGLSSRCVIVRDLPYPEMSRIYNASDIFIMPSASTRIWEEQFCMSAIEAMACGLAVVASSSGALREIVGDGGIIIPQSDFLSIYEKLKTLVLDVAFRKELSGRARKRAAEHFSMRKAGEGFTKIYEKITGR